jgi:isopenicillin N synthase-like dioxygenase
MAQDLIPVVDLRAWHAGGQERDRFVAELGEGLAHWGFAAVRGHGVDDALVERAYEVARLTFALPADVKQGCETPWNGRQRGYTSFGVEHAKDSATADIKEFWHVGRSLPTDHPLGLSGLIPPNVTPPGVPGFDEAMGALFRALEGLAVELCVAVGAFFGLPPATFRDMTRDGNSVLRIIHYPDDVPAEPGAVRAAAHEDINLMTVLPASTRPGLELMTRDGRWLAIEAPAGCMICDTGDMMQLMTAGRMPATTHRVVNPVESDGGRLSMPFFLHPHPDHVLTPIQAGWAEPVRTHDFLLRRLRANGVM